MEQTLNSGTHIICDRYAFSGIAFTSSKPSRIPFEWCRAPEISLPAPDLTIYLEVSPEKAKERGGYGEERYEKEEMQKRAHKVFDRMKVEAGYKNLVRGEHEHESQWFAIDADRSMEEVAEDVWIIVEPLVQPGALSRPLGRLWMDHLPSTKTLD